MDSDPSDPTTGYRSPHYARSQCVRFELGSQYGTFILPHTSRTYPFQVISPTVVFSCLITIDTISDALKYEITNAS